MRYLAAILAFLALVSSPAPAAKKPKQEVLVDFSGALKRVTKKEIVIDTSSDNDMTFVRTKRTTFKSGGRAMDGSALPAGIIVTVQAFEKLNGDLEAVSVTVAVADQVPNK